MLSFNPEPSTKIEGKKTHEELTLKDKGLTINLISTILLYLVQLV